MLKIRQELIGHGASISLLDPAANQNEDMTELGIRPSFDSHDKCKTWNNTYR